jgi:hypothetical protein
MSNNNVFVLQRNQAERVLTTNKTLTPKAERTNLASVRDTLNAVKANRSEFTLTTGAVVTADSDGKFVLKGYHADGFTDIAPFLDILTTP